jgi:hypothetical protein
MQVKDELVEESLRRVRQAISWIALCQVTDDENVSTRAMAKLSKVMSQATTKAGYKADACPFPLAYHVDEFKKHVSRQLDVFGLEKFPEHAERKGWHVSSLDNTASFAILEHGLQCTVDSTKDVLYASLCFDGAAMEGAVKGRVLGMLTLEVFNYLKQHRSPKGVKSEHHQHLLASAELEEETYESLCWYFKPWLSEQVAKLEDGVKRLKPVIDGMKREYKQARDEMSRVQRQVADITQQQGEQEAEQMEVEGEVQRRADHQVIMRGRQS